MSTQPQSLSDFARAALALDAEFSQFDRLARELDRLQLESDRGLERAQIILKDLEECRQRFQPASVELGRTLEDARDRTAKAAELVAQREVAVQERHATVEQLLVRYRTLGGMVEQITQSLGKLKPALGKELTPADRAELAGSVPQFDEQMGKLVDQAKVLMDDARNAKLKVLERNSDSLRQSLQAARHRIGLLMGQRDDLH